MTWIEVSVTVLPGQSDRAGDLLLRCCPQGLVEAGAPRNRRLLRVYLPSNAAGRLLLTRLRRDLVRAVAPVTIEDRPVVDDRWLGAWKAYARPIHIGRLTVLPTWMPLPRVHRRTVVRLDPGMAFGSGEHASTQLCLAAIERHVQRGITMIDVGTGSGVLAIAAAQLGAGRVLAIDNDLVAVAVARENVRANRVADRVRVRFGENLARVRLRADLIVANLTADALPGLVAGVPRRLVSGGRFVAGGFGAARVPEVRRTLAAAGLRLVMVDRLRGWRAVHAVAAPR